MPKRLYALVHHSHGLARNGYFPAVAKFILHLFSLWLSIHGRFNYINLSRYSNFHERTFCR